MIIIALAIPLQLLIGCESKNNTADLVLLNGKIVTMEDDYPEVEAIAIRGKHILAIGTEQEIKHYITDRTDIIDLQGQLAIPGLIEGHGHFLRLGEVLTQLDLTKARNWPEIVKLVAEAAINANPGDWILGWGWHQDKWEKPPSPNVEGLPTHHDLSKVSPNNPVLLNHVSGHGIFVNEKALQLAGITTTTANPPGGEIVRDVRRYAIGMLRETAAEMVWNLVDQFKASRSSQEIEAEFRNQVALAARNAIENGITSFQDMGSSFETIDKLKKMAGEGNLPIRLYLAIQESAEDLEGKLQQYRLINHGDGYLTVRTIGEKVLDGALGTHGGWLLEPYSDLPRSVGFNVTPVEDIRRSAELAIQHDYQMAIQGIGDRAARILFDIYEAEFKKNPTKNDLRWRIEHAQVIHPDDLPRFAELGVIPGIQGIFACSDGPWVLDRLGEERARERSYLFQSMIQAGAVVMNGTDPPVEDIDPIASFHCAVTRELPDGSIFFPEQRMTREQALRAYTINNAYAAFEEDIKGSLKVGKLADITVLSKDIMKIPEDEIRSAEVVYTIIGGEVKYRKAKMGESLVN
ncbi:amidohydrolase [candidate division KSB1 bacterium]|nr:amidohydrolase [candidate division KSB1 bacterium]